MINGVVFGFCSAFCIVGFIDGDHRFAVVNLVLAAIQVPFMLRATNDLD